MRKTNLRLTHFMIETKIIWLYHTTENINFFMVKVDKKRKYMVIYFLYYLTISI